MAEPQKTEQSHVVLIGGLGTIGRSLVTQLRAAGIRVTVADIKAEADDDLVIDICDAASVARVFERAGATHPITAIVNSAYPRNASYGRAFDQVTYADFAENTSLHTGGYFVVMQQAYAYFTKHERAGSVVSLSSIYGSMAPRFSVYDGTTMTMPIEYAAIKAGIEHLSRYFAQVGKPAGVRFNTLAPGGILDGQNPDFLKAYNAHCGDKGMLDAVDLIGTLSFLIGPQSRYMTGQNLIVDDGFSL